MFLGKPMLGVWGSGNAVGGQGVGAGFMKLVRVALINPSSCIYKGEVERPSQYIAHASLHAKHQTCTCSAIRSPVHMYTYQHAYTHIAQTRINIHMYMNIHNMYTSPRTDKMTFVILRLGSMSSPLFKSWDMIITCTLYKYDCCIVRICSGWR